MTILNRYVKGNKPSGKLLQEKNKACLRALAQTSKNEGASSQQALTAQRYTKERAS